MGIERRIDGLELKISAYASRWNEDFDRLHRWVMQIEDRLKVVENKSKSRDSALLRKIVEHVHSDTFSLKALKSLLEEQARWGEDDLRRYTFYKR